MSAATSPTMLGSRSSHRRPSSPSQATTVVASLAGMTNASPTLPRPCGHGTHAAYAEGVARIRVGLCQLNTVVGDLDGNVERVITAYDEAEAAGCDLAVFPELAITGYPPEDLVLKPRFIEANRDALDKVASRTGRSAAVVGFVDADRDLYNAAAMCAGGHVLGTYRKRLLPNYAVFDEQRYFAPGDNPLTAVRDRWREGRHRDLRGRVESGGPHRRPVGRRRRAHRHPERIAVLRRVGTASASEWWPPGPRTPTATSSTSTWSAGRTS